MLGKFWDVLVPYFGSKRFSSARRGEKNPYDIEPYEFLVMTSGVAYVENMD